MAVAVLILVLATAQRRLPKIKSEKNGLSQKINYRTSYILNY